MNNLETLLQKFKQQESIKSIASKILEAANIKNCKPFAFGGEQLTICIINDHMFSISKFGYDEGFDRKTYGACERYYPMYKFHKMMEQLLANDEHFIKDWLD